MKNICENSAGHSFKTINKFQGIYFYVNIESLVNIKSITILAKQPTFFLVY